MFVLGEFPQASVVSNSTSQKVIRLKRRGKEDAVCRQDTLNRPTDSTYANMKETIHGQEERLFRPTKRTEPDPICGKDNHNKTRCCWQDRVNEDLDSVVAWAAQQPDADVTRLAVMGFCYGGGKAIRYSIYNGSVAATVVFYGSPVRPSTIEVVTSGSGTSNFGYC